MGMYVPKTNTKDKWEKKIRIDYRGPYWVTNCIKDKVYVIEDLRGKLIRVYHRKRLKPYSESETTGEKKDDRTWETVEGINLMRISDSEEEIGQKDTKERMSQGIKHKKKNNTRMAYLIKGNKKNKIEEWMLRDISDPNAEPIPNIDKKDTIKIVMLPEVTIRPVI